VGVIYLYYADVYKAVPGKVKGSTPPRLPLKLENLTIF